MKLYIKIPLIIINFLFTFALITIAFMMSSMPFALMNFILGLLTMLSIWTLVNLFRLKSKKSTHSQENHSEEEVLATSFASPPTQTVNSTLFTGSPDNAPKYAKVINGRLVWK